ncbi:hypothetical protein [Flavobacterium sp. FlaQc-50]|uniref:hypothetical protein n=1 Tax=unclassified Flavobacterium TaxID=196869 RepID=UPI003757309A
MSNYKIINAKNVFIITLIIIPLTIISVWIIGLQNQRSIFENSLLSTTILSLAFFLFISIGLYNGKKMKDNLGELEQDNIFFQKNTALDSNGDIPDIGEGIMGIIVSIILWFLISIIASYLLWVFETIFWITILNFIGILYWIFFSALKLVFKKSVICKGSYSKSIFYGLSFTFLYNFWIYTILFMTMYLY